MKKVLILGIGNILQSDDGLGVYIVNEIMDSDIELSDDVEIIDGGTAGFDLLHCMSDREKIIIVDALKVHDEPGSIYRFKPDQALLSKCMYSLHEVGITEVLKMLNILGHNPEVEIIGIVPGDIVTQEIIISDAVKESVPKAIELILDAATI
jgi:hydrogenase maturation protease